MEETRITILNNLEELEQKIKDINDQMDESSREVKAMSSFYPLPAFLSFDFSFKILLPISPHA